MMTPVNDTIELSEYIEFKWFDGIVPHVKGRRIPVLLLAQDADNRTVEEIAQDYGLSETEVLAALFYYSIHADAVEQAEAAYRKKYPAPHEI